MLRLPKELIMDSFALKITWKVELSAPLEIDKNYSVWVLWSLVNISTSPNHDWTHSHTYSLKPVNVLVHNELGDTIKAKDPRRNSEKLRSKLKYDWDRWLIGTKYKEFDDCYDTFFRKIYEQYDYLVSII